MSNKLARNGTAIGKRANNGGHKTAGAKPKDPVQKCIPVCTHFPLGDVNKIGGIVKARLIAKDALIAALEGQ